MVYHKSPFRQLKIVFYHVTSQSCIPLLAYKTLLLRRPVSVLDILVRSPEVKDSLTGHNRLKVVKYCTNGFSIGSHKLGFRNVGSPVSIYVELDMSCTARKPVRDFRPGLN